MVLLHGLEPDEAVQLISSYEKFLYIWSSYTDWSLTKLFN